MSKTTNSWSEVISDRKKIKEYDTNYCTSCYSHITYNSSKEYINSKSVIRVLIPKDLIDYSKKEVDRWIRLINSFGLYCRRVKDKKADERTCYSILVFCQKKQNKLLLNCTLQAIRYVLEDKIDSLPKLIFELIDTYDIEPIYAFQMAHWIIEYYNSNHTIYQRHINYLHTLDQFKSILSKDKTSYTGSTNIEYTFSNESISGVLLSEIQELIKTKDYKKIIKKATK